MRNASGILRTPERLIISGVITKIAAGERPTVLSWRSTLLTTVLSEGTRTSCLTRSSSFMSGFKPPPTPTVLLVASTGAGESVASCVKAGAADKAITVNSTTAANSLSSMRGTMISLPVSRSALRTYRTSC